MVSVAKFDQWQNTAGVNYNNVIQVKTGLSNTETTVSSGNTATMVSFDFTPKFSTSLILVMTYHGQISKVTGGSNWCGLSVSDNLGNTFVYCGALGYPNPTGDTRYVVDQHGVVNSWSGTRTISLNVTTQLGSYIFSYQGNQTRLTLMEISQ